MTDKRRIVLLRELVEIESPTGHSDGLRAVADRVVAELERRLADDWGDVETLAAHRRARDELQALLARWEELFERSQA